ncbi:MAG: transcription termination/antitermination protein NusG [Candidatus Omnitrophica bacterium]|nr:transcription termination/antitermination protein NusG [Candidatus Omnitrophota bacterium]
MANRWYVIHTQTGAEEKVKTHIENKLKSSPHKDLISQIFVPSERVAEVKSGEKRISERKFFPGYVLIQMELTDEIWYLVKNTPGVTGFIGSGTRPLPIDDQEVDYILKQSIEKQQKPIPKIVFQKGESVRVTDGPFVNFTGVIDEVFPTKGRLKASISVFGRSTPVELEYWQVEKL